MAQIEKDLILGLERERRHRVTQVGIHWIGILANHWQLTLSHFQIVPKQMELFGTIKGKVHNLYSNRGTWLSLCTMTISDNRFLISYKLQMSSKHSGLENIQTLEQWHSLFWTLFLICSIVFRWTFLCSNEGIIPLPPHFLQLEICSIMFKETISNFARFSHPVPFSAFVFAALSACLYSIPLLSG